MQMNVQAALLLSVGSYSTGLCHGWKLDAITGQLLFFSRISTLISMVAALIYIPRDSVQGPFPTPLPGCQLPFIFLMAHGTSCFVTVFTL